MASGSGRCKKPQSLAFLLECPPHIPKEQMWLWCFHYIILFYRNSNMSAGSPKTGPATDSWGLVQDWLHVVRGGWSTHSQVGPGGAGSGGRRLLRSGLDRWQTAKQICTTVCTPNVDTNTPLTHVSHPPNTNGHTQTDNTYLPLSLHHNTSLEGFRGPESETNMAMKRIQA